MPAKITGYTVDTDWQLEICMTKLPTQQNCILFLLLKISVGLIVYSWTHQLLSNSYSTVARDLLLKTIPRPRASGCVFNDKSHGYRAVTILYPRHMALASQPNLNLKSIATWTFCVEREMACPFSSACLGLCEWTGCPGPDGSSRRIGSIGMGVAGVAVATLALAPGQPVHLHGLGWLASAMRLACIRPIR